MKASPSNALFFGLQDGLRRLEYNFYEMVSARPIKTRHGTRTANKIKGFAYSNYLSSYFSMTELTKSYCRRCGIQNHFKLIEGVIENDELLKYAREARHAQDHNIVGSATSPILNGDFVPLPGFAVSRQIVRGRFALYPVVSKHKGVTIGIPTKHLGQEIYNVDPDLVAHLSYNWWYHVVNHILRETYQIPY